MLSFATLLKREISTKNVFDEIVKNFNATGTFL